MGLKVRQLKFITEDIVRNQRLLEALRQEVRGVFGCLINISEGLDDACYQVNDMLDVARAKGDNQQIVIKTSLLKKLIESNSDEARRLAARLLPRNLIINYRFDNNAQVRAEVCRRLPANLIAEVAENFPRDYEVQYILQEKNAHEDEHLHIHNEKRIGDAAKPVFQPEMSDLWYREKARLFLEEYGGNIEYQWEETLVKRYCSSVKATSGIEIDSQKMYETLMDLIIEREEEALLRDERKKIKSLEKIRESCEPLEPSFQGDDLKTLLSTIHSPQGFIQEVNKKFSVRESTIPSSLRKYSAGGTLSIPMKARIPGGKLNHLVENVLDNYVSKWNEIQVVRGEPLVLNWDVDPVNEGNVCFRVILR